MADSQRAPLLRGRTSDHQALDGRETIRLFASRVHDRFRTRLWEVFMLADRSVNVLWPRFSRRCRISSCMLWKKLSDRRFHYRMVTPASTFNCVPVMYRASSETRNRTALLTSAGATMSTGRAF